MLNEVFFHGSQMNDISSFDLKYANSNAPFGPAVYLTKDVQVAKCYSYSAGSIYRVQLTGNIEQCINLDATFEEQSMPVKRALETIFPGISSDKPLDIRERMHFDYFDDRDTNSMMADAGIWMLYGSLSSMEIGGFQDRGVQYAVIDTQYIMIQGKSPHHEC